VWLLVSVLVSCWPESWEWGCRGRASQHVSWLDPIGRYGDRLAAHKELQRFLSPREDLVGAGVRGLQSPACCILAEEDVRAGAFRTRAQLRMLVDLPCMKCGFPGEPVEEPLFTAGPRGT
jgi:hypothetical protein